jgi:hypothetical protein
MRAFSLIAIFIFSSLGLLCTSKKKPSLAGEEPVAVEDFIDFFEEWKAPVHIEDTFLLKKDFDSLRISREVLSQFVPDSVLNKLLGAKAKPRFYALGKLPLNETYLLLKTISGNKRNVLLLAFTKKNEFLAATHFLEPDAASNTRQYSEISRKEEINKHTIRRNANGTVDEGRDVFVLNTASREFTMILTDPLNKKPPELINPIDTLSKKMKYTADYGSGKTNIFSFRDGRRSGRLEFFIHFEKNNGECIGELRGEASMKAPNRAEYREPGEPCALQFTFTSSSVTVKELEPCGSRRGLRCSFDGTYPRKKETKPRTSTKKTK